MQNYQEEIIQHADSWGAGFRQWLCLIHLLPLCLMLKAAIAPQQ